jgi:hypothetical protein
MTAIEAGSIALSLEVVRLSRRRSLIFGECILGFILPRIAGPSASETLFKPSVRERLRVTFGGDRQIFAACFIERQQDAVSNAEIGAV